MINLDRTRQEDKQAMTDATIKQRHLFKQCRTCGGYGYNMLTEHGNAQRCPSCRGDKISRESLVREVSNFQTCN